MIDERDWMIVAPWWRWSSPVDPAAGRLTRPTIQKYDSPSLVNDFLKNPQRCLRWNDAVDVVSVPAPLPELPDVDGKKRRLSDAMTQPDAWRTRKIFLDAHKRFYLVVCQIHCDAPGFPRASRDGVCEVGLVVRRRRAAASPEALAAGERTLADLATAQKEAARIDAILRAPLPSPERRGLQAAIDRRTRSLARKWRPSVQESLAAASRRYIEWQERFGVTAVLEGWLRSPDDHDRIGAWKPVDEAPADLGDEAAYPMYPLFADPTVPDHAGKHGLIYFGLLPTGGSDTDEHGRARFDDGDLYEVACYVKRHGERHGRGEPCKCPHGIFWSAPTTPYRLAPHFDLDGTSNRPVTVQLPDLADLAASARPSLGLGFKKPPGSLMVTSNSSKEIISRGTSAAVEVCFVAIPLITIVATFVLELFMAIVVFLFGLFWMLRLRFCIPPAVGIDARASLAAKVDADLAVNGAVDASLGTSADGVDLDAQVNADVDALFGAEVSAGLKSRYTTGALAELEVASLRASASVEGAAGVPGPSLTAGLEWEAEVIYR
ncbi:hypothetical protein [Sorangium sp. So ce854]|uniref:hypothetical protein n=1 Tax=Sorangium sp. So ce854 TaxID=3133322 RepID=UPI003F5FBADC